jgi:hypothetical protein
MRRRHITSPVRSRKDAQARTTGTTLLLAAVLVACSGDRPSPDSDFEVPRGPVPESEFVLSAGDSTFWVRTGAHGVSVRGSPLLLARADGRFYELYVTDDDRSYRDAVLVGQRLWRRDLVTNDSAVVFADSAVGALARRWARENPLDRPLRPDEEEGDDPLVIASGELAVLDVVGPYVSFEWLADLHPLGEQPTHRLHRGVRDVRSGRAVALRTLVGDSAAGALLSEANRAFRAATDSLARGELAQGEYIFDASSFALGVEGGSPVIAFLAPARTGSAGELAGIPLPSLPVKPLDWWNEHVRAERSKSVGRVIEESWKAGADLKLVARYESGGLVRLLLRQEAGNAGVGDERGAAREWQLGRVTPPVQRVYWFDQPPVDSSTRAALERAFDDADRYELELPVAPLPPLQFAERRETARPAPVVATLSARP